MTDIVKVIDTNSKLSEVKPIDLLKSITKATARYDNLDKVEMIIGELFFTYYLGQPHTDKEIMSFARLFRTNHRTNYSDMLPLEIKKPWDFIKGEVMKTKVFRTIYDGFRNLPQSEKALLVAIVEYYEDYTTDDILNLIQESTIIYDERNPYKNVGDVLFEDWFLENFDYTSNFEQDSDQWWFIMETYMQYVAPKNYDNLLSRLSNGIKKTSLVV